MPESVSDETEQKVTIPKSASSKAENEPTLPQPPD